ncbi:MAG: alkaline phosphatase family protein [Actinobacteria bacterium]|nr:alkaline phosphatase family protein [Actinomycetota bacterium]
MPELTVGPVLRHVGPTHATVWVETDAPCTVSVVGHEARTVTVEGHHYALVVVRDLRPGTVTEYDVRLDGEAVWPPPPGAGGPAFPPSRIRTLGHDGPVRVSFGSCRYATPRALTGAASYGPDSLDALAHRLAAAVRSGADDVWPDLLLLLGDQVYADETTDEVRRRIRERRGGDSEPRGEVADFEEYTWLYRESWCDAEVRWLLSTVPTAMIFDDHDVHDDWNTSGAWRRDAAQQPWWAGRIVAGLSSYWVYQHLGNLSPDELDADPTWCAVRDLPSGTDAGPLLRALAVRADAEADGAKGYRWSFRRDLGPVRLVVLDSRCGRMLDGDRRSMLSDPEWEWVGRQLTLAPGDGVEHVLVGTSLPWLLAPALHDVEAWDERLAADRRPRRAAFGERVRRGADLEHWAAFGEAFERLAGQLHGLARGARGPAPATVSVLSGDVHHSYVCRAHWPQGDGPALSAVHQVTCSPLHNQVPTPMRLAFRLAWSGAARRTARALLGALGGAPRPSLAWDLVAGPHFGNALATLVLAGRRASLVVEGTTPAPDGDPGAGPGLRVLAATDLSAGGRGA